MEFNMSRDIYESVTLDIKGAYLSYPLKNDALQYEFHITSQNKESIEYYDYKGSVFILDEITYSSSSQYSKDLNLYIPFNVAIQYEPFRIAIRYDDRYLLAPVNNIEDALKLTKFFEQFLFP
jgi:hypothetical protein